MRPYPTKIPKVGFKTLLQQFCYGGTIKNNHNSLIQMSVLLFCLACSCFSVGVYCKY